MGPRSRTPYTILGCLTIEPMSGYGIKRFLERSVAHFWSESYGQLYPALRKLEDEGLVRGRDEPGARGGQRRVYRITRPGRAALRAWLKEPADAVTPRYEYSLKIFFGHNVGPSASLAHVQRQRRAATEALAAYRAYEQQLEGRVKQAPDSPAPYWLVVLRGGIRYAEMVLAWCEESEKALMALPETAVAR